MLFKYVCTNVTIVADVVNDMFIITLYEKLGPPPKKSTRAFRRFVRLYSWPALTRCLRRRRGVLLMVRT
jgi:hypothetical protein